MDHLSVSDGNGSRLARTVRGDHDRANTRALTVRTGAVAQATVLALDTARREARDLCLFRAAIGSDAEGTPATRARQCAILGALDARHAKGAQRTRVRLTPLVRVAGQAAS